MAKTKAQAKANMAAEKARRKKKATAKKKMAARKRGEANIKARAAAGPTRASDVLGGEGSLIDTIRKRRKKIGSY